MFSIRTHCALLVIITTSIILTTSSAGKITETLWLKRKIRKMTKKMVGFKDEIDQAGKNITNVQVTIHVCY